MEDWELIRAYVKRGEENAFTELVNRHLNLVYSVALRILGGNHALAEDASQRTFSLLARKSHTLLPGVNITGWLHRAAYNVSRDLARSERRREFHEKEAACMHPLSFAPDTSALWQNLSPELDAALVELAESERLPLLLRFFERKSMKEVAAALRISEDAAKMRVSRCVEKLRKALFRRGVTITTGALVCALSRHATEAAPAALAQSLIQSLSALKTGSTVAIPGAKLILMTTFQKAVMTGSCIIFAGLIGMSELRKQNTMPVSESLPDGSERKTPGTFESLGVAPSSHADRVFDDAIKNLQLALSAPWETRRAPLARIERAIEAFDSEKGRALPALMNVVTTPRQERSLAAFILACHGLQLLGPDAAPAWPELRKLVRDGDFALLNDQLPRLLAAISPNGEIVPDLVRCIAENPRGGAYWTGAGINEIIKNSPQLLQRYSPSIQALLDHDEQEVRRNAALIMARLPGEKDPSALPVLLEALDIEKHDPANAPDEMPGVLTVGDKFESDHWRLKSIQALREFGPAAKEAVPALLAVASQTEETNQFRLREYALSAIAAIDPTYAGGEVKETVARQQRAQELAERARSGRATFGELQEALKFRDSADAASERLAELGTEARPALPQLLEAIDAFDFSEAVRTVQQLDPDLLVQRLQDKNYKNLSDVASAIGELGPGMSYALPHLEAALADLRPDDYATVQAVASAIEQINPGYPKLVYNFKDLEEPSNALVQSIYDSGKINSPVYDAYIRDFQDRNAVPRPHLLRFVEATKGDPELHRVFVDALLRKHPDLALSLSK